MLHFRTFCTSCQTNFRHLTETQLKSNVLEYTDTKILYQAITSLRQCLKQSLLQKGSLPWSYFINIFYCTVKFSNGFIFAGFWWSDSWWLAVVNLTLWLFCTQDPREPVLVMSLVMQHLFQHHRVLSQLFLMWKQYSIKVNKLYRYSTRIWCKLRSISSSYSAIVWVRVILKRTVVCDRHFDNLSRSRLQSQMNHCLTNTIHLTLKMTSAQIASVTNNRSFQNYPRPDDHRIQSKLYNVLSE